MMPEKINPNVKCCNMWYERKTGTPIKQEIGASCKWNLFAHCWINDKEEPVVIRALQGNREAQLECHSRLETKRRTD